MMERQVRETDGHKKMKRRDSRSMNVLVDTDLESDSAQSGFNNVDIEEFLRLQPKKVFGTHESNRVKLRKSIIERNCLSTKLASSTPARDFHLTFNNSAALSPIPRNDFGRNTEGKSKIYSVNRGPSVVMQNGELVYSFIENTEREIPVIRNTPKEFSSKRSYRQQRSLSKQNNGVSDSESSSLESDREKLFKKHKTRTNSKEPHTFRGYLVNEQYQRSLAEYKNNRQASAFQNSSRQEIHKNEIIHKESSLQQKHKSSPKRNHWRSHISFSSSENENICQENNSVRLNAAELYNSIINVRGNNSCVNCSANLRNGEIQSKREEIRVVENSSRHRINENKSVTNEYVSNKERRNGEESGSEISSSHSETEITLTTDSEADVFSKTKNRHKRPVKSVKDRTKSNKSGIKNDVSRLETPVDVGVGFENEAGNKILQQSNNNNKRRKDDILLNAKDKNVESDKKSAENTDECTPAWVNEMCQRNYNHSFNKKTNKLNQIVDKIVFQRKKSVASLQEHEINSEITEIDGRVINTDILSADTSHKHLISKRGESRHEDGENIPSSRSDGKDLVSKRRKSFVNEREDEKNLPLSDYVNNDVLSVETSHKSLISKGRKRFTSQHEGEEILELLGTDENAKHKQVPSFEKSQKRPISKPGERLTSQHEDEEISELAGTDENAKNNGVPPFEKGLTRPISKRGKRLKSQREGEENLELPSTDKSAINNRASAGEASHKSSVSKGGKRVAIQREDEGNVQLLGSGNNGVLCADRKRKHPVTTKRGNSFDSLHQNEKNFQSGSDGNAINSGLLSMNTTNTHATILDHHAGETGHVEEVNNVARQTVRPKRNRKTLKDKKSLEEDVNKAESEAKGLRRSQRERKTRNTNRMCILFTYNKRLPVAYKASEESIEYAKNIKPRKKKIGQKKLKTIDRSGEYKSKQSQKKSKKNKKSSVLAQSDSACEPEYRENEDAVSFDFDSLSDNNAKIYGRKQKKSPEIGSSKLNTKKKTHSVTQIENDCAQRRETVHLTVPINNSLQQIEWFSDYSRKLQDLDVTLNSTHVMNCLDIPSRLASSILVICPLENKQGLISKKYCFVFYITDGTAEVSVQNRFMTGGPGSHFYIPLGCEYSIKNLSSKKKLSLFCIKLLSH